MILTDADRNALGKLAEMLKMRERYYRQTTLRHGTADQFAAWCALIDKVRSAREVKK